MPEAHAQANANLFVSVEESFSPDRFGGAMVAEVVVNDPDLKDTNEQETEPDVTVNGKTLRMAQSSDGNWYAYIADLQNAQNADVLSTLAGTGLDFGSGCTATTATLAAGISFSDTEGVYFPKLPAGLPGSNPLGACAAGAQTGPDINNVIRENKTLTPAQGGPPIIALGQLTGLITNTFPFIQLYDFTPGGDAKIVYNIGGGSPQTVTLEFDDSLDSYGTLSKDRTSYTQGADVHITISDNWLNVDPTDEDSWSFGTNGTIATTTVYQAYDENGASAGALVANQPLGTNDITAGLASIDAGDLGVLEINANPNNAPVDGILNLQDNGDTILNTVVGNASDAFNTDPVGGIVPTANLGLNSVPVTVVETEASSGIFQATDESDTSQIFVALDAPRGTTATIDYNDSASSILVANFFGTLSMDEAALGGEWNSGEELSVLLTDQDINLNSRIDEDISLADPRFTLIPSLRIGSPITLAGGNATFRTLTGVPGFADGNPNLAGVNTNVDAFSDVARPLSAVQQIIPAPTAGNLTFTLASTGVQVKAFTGSTAQHARYAYLNYDIRSFEEGFNSVAFTIRITNVTGAGPVVTLAPITDYQGLIPITTETSFPPVLFGNAIGGPALAAVNFQFAALAGGAVLNATTYPAVVDFFNYGTSGDGNLASERFNNAIYRFELEETGDNTAQFEGTAEYVMLNQLNTNQSITFPNSVTTISDQPRLVAHEDLTDEDAPRINYLDKGADGVSTQIADQQEAPTHSGVVSFSSSTYKVADTVDVTLEPRPKRRC
jgi:hypothetical protein